MKLTKRLAAAPLLVTALLTFASGVSAQGGGTIRGVVTSAESHAVINAARVAIENPARVALTDNKGQYVLRDVPAGTYDMVVTAIGQAPTHVSVTVSGGSQTLDVAMQPGALLLSSLIVSGTRTPTPSNRVTSTVNVLTPQEIATSPARETQDMLREMPGVELPRTSSLVGGSAQIVSIRGVDEGRTNVLFDGIPVNDAWGEWIDWGRVPKNMLDHVEVVEGGTSTLYGNGAIGGVISFFSRPIAPGSMTMTLDAGSRDARHAFLGAGIPITAGLTANVTGDYLEGGGYTLIDPAKRGTVDIASGIVQRNAYARLNYNPADSKLSGFLTGHLFSDNRATGTPFGRTSRDQKNVDLGANYGTAGDGLFTLRGWYGHQDEDQRAASIRTTFATCPTPGTAARQCEDSSAIVTIPSNDRGASLQWSRNNIFHLQSLAIGGDYRHMDGTYDESDYNTTCPGANCGKFVRSISSGGDQALSGAFVQAIAAPIEPLLIELGARVDHWANTNAHSNDPIAGDTSYADRSKTAVSPRLGARYAVNSRLSLHGAAYKAFRAPNLAELYRKQINASASQITLPNPDLKPESGKGIEGGFDFQPISMVQLKATYYVADYTDFNVPVTISNGPPAIRQRLNINKSRSKGGEAYVAVRPIEQLLFSASVNYDDARIVAKDSTNGRHINRVPSPKQTIRATYSTPLIGSVTGLWRHEGTTTTLQGLPLKPFTVVDANYQRDIVRGATVFFSVENITDEKYQINVSGTGAAAIYSFGMPRTFHAGLTLTH